MSKENIVRIEIYLELPQHDLGVWRLNSVIGYTADEKKHPYDELIDNTEYNDADDNTDEVMDEIIKDVAKRTSESEDIIRIINRP
jgi:hypothetical protein